MHVPTASAPTSGPDGLRGNSRPLGRRPRSPIVAALLALVTAASVLVVAHGPAQAAAADVRTERLRGPSRYDTAAAIADAYVDEVEDSINDVEVEVAILTSGEDEHFGYVLPAPVLASHQTAPILLTETDTLPNAVRRFLENHRIRKVIILGGSDVVSEEVEREVDALAGVDADRYVGRDVYDTAVQVAQEIGAPGEFGRLGRTVMLATAANFADALAAGPLSYRGEHPILLTDRDRISDGVLDYIKGASVDHVVILGGESAIGLDVELDVADLGVKVTRWRGATRIETAIEIADELLGENTPQSCFDGGEVGLAYAWKHPDAIVSGPYLGELCAPLLLTDQATLPRVVRNVLEADDFLDGDFRGRLRITAFGGTAAISSGVLNAAESAAQLDALNARVTASEGACHFTVTFSEPVLTRDALSVRNYLLNSELFEIGEGSVEGEGASMTSEVRVVLGGSVTHTGAAVPTGCRRPLAARDTVGVAPNRIFAAADRRTVRRVDVSVRSDVGRPRLTITAPQGATVVEVEASEPVRPADDASSIAVEFRRSGLSSILITVGVPPGATRFEVIVPTEFDVFSTTPPTQGLLARDQVIINAGELEDLAENENPRTLRSVAVDNAGPRVNRVTVTDPASVQQAYVSLDGEDSQNDAQVGVFRITARDGAAADGAAGNEWSAEMEVLRTRPTNWRSSQNVAVTLNQTLKTMSISAMDDATLSAIRHELNGDAAFGSLFEAEVIAGRDSFNPVASGSQLRFSGGSSTVDVTVYWNEPVKGCDAVAHEAVRPQAIEIDLDRDGTTEFALDGFLYDRTRDVTFVGDISGRTSIIAGRATCDVDTPGARSGTLVARIQSANIDDLPSPRSNALVRPQAAYDLSGNPNQLQPAVTLRRA